MPRQPKVNSEVVNFEAGLWQVIAASITSSQMDSCLSTFWCHYSNKRSHYFPSSGNWYRKENFAADRIKMANKSESSMWDKYEDKQLRSRRFLCGKVIGPIDKDFTDWRLYVTRVLHILRRLVATLRNAWGFEISQNDSSLVGFVYVELICFKYFQSHLFFVALNTIL